MTATATTSKTDKLLQRLTESVEKLAKAHRAHGLWARARQEEERAVRDRFAVLVDVGCDWPEVVFVGDHPDAMLIAQAIPDEIGGSVQAVVALDEAIAEAEGAS